MNGSLLGALGKQTIWRILLRTYRESNFTFVFNSLNLDNMPEMFIQAAELCSVFLHFFDKGFFCAIMQMIFN